MKHIDEYPELLTVPHICEITDSCENTVRKLLHGQQMLSQSIVSAGNISCPRNRFGMQ